MNIIDEFINRIKKNEGLFIFKNQLLSQIRTANKDQFAIKYEPSKNILIVAIPVNKNFKV
jgi:hypothetical protein